MVTGCIQIILNDGLHCIINWEEEAFLPVSLTNVYNIHNSSTMGLPIDLFQLKMKTIGIH